MGNDISLLHHAKQCLPYFAAAVRKTAGEGKKMTEKREAGLNEKKRKKAEQREEKVGEKK